MFVRSALTLISILMVLSQGLFASQTEQRAELEAKLSANPHDPALLTELCQILTKMNEPDAAVERGKQAIAAAPNSSAAHYHYAFALRSKMGSNPMAWMANGSTYLGLLEKAIQLDPSYVDPYVELASFYNYAPAIAGGSREKAMEVANRLIAQDRKAGNLLLIDVVGFGNHFDEARPISEKLLAEYGNDGKVLQKHGEVLCGLERYADAAPFLKKSLEQDGSLAYSRYLLGLTRLKSGAELQLAIADFDDYLKAIDASDLSSRARGLWRKGSTWLAMGEKELAKKALAESLELNPKNEECRKQLAEL